MAEQLEKERTESAEKTKPPSFYDVVMLNDDYTPMEFVVHVLKSIFFMDEARATTIMLEVHQRGGAVCGTYTLDVARTKANRVQELAEQQQYPLHCRVEPAAPNKGMGGE
ncbi:MAG: ATP-dependent Clp protease adapter ClpS [Pseudomonadota bacterium]